MSPVLSFIIYSHFLQQSTINTNLDYIREKIQVFNPAPATNVEDVNRVLSFSLSVRHYSSISSSINLSRLQSQLRLLLLCPIITLTELPPPSQRMEK